MTKTKVVEPPTHYPVTSWNQEVATRTVKDGVEYWIRGYRVLDPREVHSGKAKLRGGNVWTTGFNQQRKPVQRPIADVRLLAKCPKTYTFAEVYGTASGTGQILQGVSFAEAEDLSLGVAPDEEELNDDE